MDRQPFQSILIGIIILMVVGFSMWGINKLPPIFANTIEEIPACLHETIQSEIDGTLITMYIPVLNLVKGQKINQMFKASYCTECKVVIVNHTKLYIYTELLNEVSQ